MFGDANGDKLVVGKGSRCGLEGAVFARVRSCFGILVLIDNPWLDLVCESSRLGNRNDRIFVCPSSQANNAFVSSSVVMSFKNVRLLSPNAEWWERKEKLKEGRVREIKLDMRSSARVNDAVNSAFFCWMS